MLTQPILIAIGQLKDSPEKALFDQYVVRLAKPLHVIQIKQLNDPEKEGNAIMQHITPHDWVCALDERGKNMSSIEFSTHLQESLSTTKRHIFIIGGADGLSQEVRHKAQLLLSFLQTAQLCTTQACWQSSTTKVRGSNSSCAVPTQTR